MTTPVPQDEIIIDGARLRGAFRRQGRRWLWLGPLFAGGLLLLLAALVPRSYTAITSVALQQPTGGGSALALLTGGGAGPSKRYLGVLKSRALAETVESHVHLRQLYGSKTYRTEEDAVEFLTKSVKPEDSATDGLLYVSVTLPGPPKLALSPSPTPKQAADTAADAANDYALALKDYYATSDTDQGSVLLRGADKEVKQARTNYDDALARSLAFTRGLSGVDPRSAPASSSSTTDSAGFSSAGSGSTFGSDPSAGPGAGRPAGRSSTDATTAASRLGALYASRDQVQAELRSAQAVRAAGQQLIGSQLRDLSSVPADDPLLADARSRVTQDQSVYNTVSRLYGPENPQVIQAQTRLSVDQADLDRQVQGVKLSLTTPDIRSTEEIQGLLAREAVLTRQIAQAERHLGISRRLSGEAGRLEAEVSIQLDVLRTTLTEAARIRLENASSLNRMTVIDSAIAPKNGEPGLGKLAALCVLLAALSYLAAVAAEYFRAAPQRTEPADPPVTGVNGTGTVYAEGVQSAAPRTGSTQ